MSAQIERHGDEQLVAIRREVLNDVEHAVGNLLQRVHHVARDAGVGAAQGQRLQSALNDLERLLELLFDYVSPVDVQVRPTDADSIAESLAAQLRAQGVAEIGHGPAAGLQVLADPRVLTRSFLLLARVCAPECEAGGQVAVELVRDPAGDRVQFLVQAAPDRLPPISAQSSLATAVAGRLIELQGGELHARPRPSCACAVVLPLAS